MKRKRLLGTVYSVFCILIFILLFIMISLKNSQELPQNPYISVENYYTVSEYQGKIAVFKNKDKIPFEIYESYVETFPEHDRELLKKGIRVETAEDLQKVIEDYT